MRCHLSRGAASALIAILPAFALAQPAPQAGQAKQEIAYLLATVVSSHCEFNRNGDWYDSAAARAHLQQKYEKSFGKQGADSDTTLMQRR